MNNKKTKTTIKNEFAVYAKVKSTGKFRFITINRYPTAEQAMKAHEEWMKVWAKHDDTFDLTTAELRSRTVITVTTEWEKVQ